MKLTSQKQVWIVVICLLAGVLLLSCAESKEEMMRKRYEEFRSILPSAVIVSFDKKDFEGAASQVDSLLKVDNNFAASWEQLKKSEAIQLFSTKDVFDYYSTYFAKYGTAK